MRSVFLVLLVLLVACGPATDPASSSTTAADSDARSSSPVTTQPAVAVPVVEIPDAPPTPEGPVGSDALAALDLLWDGLGPEITPEQIGNLAQFHDPRLAWPLTDLMRFLRTPSTVSAAQQAFEGLTGTGLAASNPWTEAVNLLIAWDTPAPPGYLEYKRQLFLLIDQRWAPFFSRPTDLDYRLLNWGGVLIDDRPLGDTDPCPSGCIPALDDPVVTEAEGGDWLSDDFPVFGIVVGDEARAYPKHIMEIHEMVNDTVGGRRIAFPYCTLCGSAQVYFTDTLDTEIVMRTSGLLSRSNKVMFDLTTMSAFDTFTGVAVTGPLLEQRVTLDEATVVTSTWGEWRAAHPATTIVAEDGGIGRSYDLDPLGGRDDNGPIFPIGDRDTRLPVQEQVIGVVQEDGTAVAFPVADARWEMAIEGGDVEMAGVKLVPDGGGLRAVMADGSTATSHQAFWFAWSQFHPDTLLWRPES